MMKQGFNLIEIALTIAIIAVGLSSILVLFPVGMNAANAASADNQMTDVADYILGYMECRAQAEWRNADNTARTIAENPFLNSLKDFATVKPSGEEDKIGNKTNGIDVDADASGWTDVSGGNKTLYNKTIDDSCPVFYYRQKYEINGTPVTDFAAVVLVWKEDVWTTLRKGDKTPADRQKIENYTVALCAEISFPAEKPYKEREKYLFRRIICNQAN